MLVMIAVSQDITMDNINLKPIPGYEGLYSINEMGNVYSISGKRYKTRKGRWLVTSENKNGYNCVRLSDGRGGKKHFNIHRLMHMTFFGYNNAFVINHLNGNKRDNRLSNLEVCTQSENILHAFRTGLKQKTYGRQKLTLEQAREIRMRREAGEKGVTLAKEFNVTTTAICNIYKRRCHEEQHSTQ